MSKINLAQKKIKIYHTVNIIMNASLEEASFYTYVYPEVIKYSGNHQILVIKP
jgi:hypothetical protein